MNLTLERARSPTYPHLSPLAQDVLRVTAITAMVLDHVNKAFFNNDIAIFTLAGRLAFPLFALLIAHNIQARGVPWQRYMLPLLIAGVAAQLPFMTLFQPLLNTMFTLLLGILIAPTSVWLDSKLGKGSGSFAWVLLALPNLLMDYPLFGAWLVPLAGFLVVRKVWWSWIPFLAAGLFSNQFTPPSFVLLALPLLVHGAALLEGQRLRVPRWGWYAFYPVHLFVIAVLVKL